MKNRDAKIYSLAGVWQAVTEDGIVYSMRLPGSLDENNIGEAPAEEPDDGNFAFDRKLVFEGPVKYSKLLTFTGEMHKRYFLVAERTRVLSLFLDGEEIPASQGTLLSPYVFELTGKLSENHLLSLVSDNSYPDLPREEILASNMASERTATNWNGILGDLGIVEEEPVFIENAVVFPEAGLLRAEVTLNAAYAFDGELYFHSDLLDLPTAIHVSGKSGRHVFRAELPVSGNAARFDEEAGNLFDFRVVFGESSYSIRTGFRTFEATPGGFLLNGRPFFLRGETSESLHPETAYAPFRKEAWERVFREYVSYGVNFVRFAMHCPMDSAFQAADEAGALVMPELSCGSHPGENAEAYYRKELTELLDSYGHHPSLVAVGLPFGDGEKALLEDLIRFGKEKRPDLLFTGLPDTASTEQDFYIREELPVFFEADRPYVKNGAGNFAMLPDLRETDLFSGVLLPKKLEAFGERVRENGLGGAWEKYVEGSGETMLVRYREAIRPFFRDKAVAGLLLTGLQDVPGRATAPQGMLTPHLIPKPYPFAKPENFRSFFGPVTLLPILKKHCFTEGEQADLPVEIAYFGKEPFTGPFTFRMDDGERTVTGRIEDLTVLPGERKELAVLGDIAGEFSPTDGRGVNVTGTVRYAGTEAVFRFGVYPHLVPICPESVYETSVLDLRATEFLKEGGNVFLTPALPALPEPVSQVIEKDHPVFRYLNPGAFTDECLEHLSDRPGFRLSDKVHPIVGVLPVREEGPVTAELFEARVLNGAVLVSSLALKEKIREPEVAALVAGIYEYMASYDFTPSRTLTLRELTEVLQTAKEGPWRRS